MLFLVPCIPASCYNLCSHILRVTETNQRIILDNDAVLMDRLHELLSMFSPVPSPPFPPSPPMPPMVPPSPRYPPELPDVSEGGANEWMYALIAVGCVLLCFTHPLTLLCCLYERHHLV